MAANVSSKVKEQRVDRVVSDVRVLVLGPSGGAERCLSFWLESTGLERRQPDDYLPNN